ncbi:MAG: VOC family protein [Ginsengibacter sp.]
MQQIKTFLMFEGKAEEAMNFYTSLFANSQITNVVKYEANEPGIEGSVKHATFLSNDQVFMCMDSLGHDFTFSASMSLYVTCTTETEIDALFAKLSDEGQVFMPLANYPFSKKFGWVADKYGVSWQLNLES